MRIRMGVDSRSKSLSKLSSWDSVMGWFGKKKKADPISDNLELKPISLEVDVAYLEDQGHVIARIDNYLMRTCKISDGDIIEIKGKRRTVARCFPLPSRDKGKGIIRIDGLVRNNEIYVFF